MLNNKTYIPTVFTYHHCLITVDSLENRMIITVWSLNKAFHQRRNPRAMTFLCWLHHMARVVEIFLYSAIEDFLESCKTWNTYIHVGGQDETHSIFEFRV